MHGKFASGMKTVAKWGGIFFGAAAAVGGAIIGVATKAANMADAIDENSQKLGLSRKAYQELGYVMRQNGMEIDSFKTGMKTLTNTVYKATQGNEAATKTFSDLGVALKDANGQTRSQEEIMWDTLSALQKMTNQTEKAAMANKLFGKQGAELMPILNGDAKSLEEMRKQANDLGIVLDDTAIDAGAKFADSMQTLKDAGSSAFASIALEFIPYLQMLLDWVLKHMPEIKEFIKTALDTVGAAIEFVKPIIKSLAPAFQAMFDIVINIFKTFSALFNGDWSALWSGLGTIVEGFFEIFKTIGKSLFGKLFEGIKEKWTSIKEWVDEKIQWIKDQFLSLGINIKEMRDNGGGRPHASGINFVPYDGYQATLHRGERVVTANDNFDSTGEIVSLLKAILNKGNQSIILDTGVLVGATAESMDMALGRLQRRR